MADEQTAVKTKTIYSDGCDENVLIGLVPMSEIQDCWDEFHLAKMCPRYCMKCRYTWVITCFSDYSRRFEKNLYPCQKVYDKSTYNKIHIENYELVALKFDIPSIIQTGELYTQLSLLENKHRYDHCICAHYIEKNFYIFNRHTNIALPVGCVCVEKCNGAFYRNEINKLNNERTAFVKQFKENIATKNVNAIRAYKLALQAEIELKKKLEPKKCECGRKIDKKFTQCYSCNIKTKTELCKCGARINKKYKLCYTCYHK